MSGLVLELQSDALNRNIRVVDLLRKALVVSKKLAVKHIIEWLSYELNGYGRNSQVPDYREIFGQIKVWNPYHGWQPLNFGDHEIAEALSRRKIMQPVGELDSLLENNKESHLQVNFPQHIINSLMEQMNVPLQPTLHVAPTEIVGILDAVRNIVLEWALQLEEEGVIGEGMSFSNEEKRTAEKITYQITNNIGSMYGSQIQQHSPGATQDIGLFSNVDELLKFISKIKTSIDAIPLPDHSKDEIRAEIATVAAQAMSPKPKPRILKESLMSIKNILEGAAGNVIANGLIARIGSFLS